jgi:hypothetical protein
MGWHRWSGIRGMLAVDRFGDQPYEVIYREFDYVGNVIDQAKLVHGR